MVSPPVEPVLVDYQDEVTLAKFAAVLPFLRRDLARHKNKVLSCTADQLADFAAAFAQFQFKTLGIASVIEATRQSLTRKQRRTSAASDSSNNTTPTTPTNPATLPPCLPASCFATNELTPASPLYVVLRTALAHESDLDKWQFTKKRDEYLAVVDAMYESLETAGHFDAPRIAFAPNPDNTPIDHATSLKTRIAELKGIYVDDPAHASHILHFDQQLTHQKRKERRSQRAVRIIRHPNTKKQQKDQQLHADDDHDDGDSNIHVHWCRLPDSFDQWLPEHAIKDLKIVSSEKKSEKDGSSDAPIHLSADWLTDSYTYNTWMNAADYVYTSDDDAPSSSGKRASDEVAADQADNAQGDRAKDAHASKRAKPADAYLAKQPFEVIIPSYATWFEFHQIHNNERTALPEFFAGHATKTPNDYVNMRNFMVHTYRHNPLEYLTVTACRRNLLGDVAAITRIHAFLEKWGLINYQMDPRLRPSNLGPPFAGKFNLVLDTPQHLRSPSTPELSASASSSTTTTTTTATTATTITAPTTPGVSASSSQSTKASPVPRKSASTPAVSLELHDTIYDVPSRVIEDEKELSPQQELLLMEALAMYKHDWDAVAAHVGVSRDACILHYLTLPLHDPYVDLELLQHGLHQHYCNEEKRRMTTHPDDPLHTILSFLSQHAEPRIVDRQQKQKCAEQQPAPQPSTANAAAAEAFKSLVATHLQRYRAALAHFREKEQCIQDERLRLAKEQTILAMDKSSLHQQAHLIVKAHAKRQPASPAPAPHNQQQQQQQQQQHQQHQQAPPPPHPSHHVAIAAAAFATSSTPNPL
ncbi:hypothetical protein BC940DRAFT_290552 [Gongronella butleri]|nr:hypothetical protein BC940DRAFT_290552 [Gongronella butleri]